MSCRYHCDMWSIGVVMFIMLFGFPPFHGQTDASTQRKIIHGFDPRVMAGLFALFHLFLCACTLRQTRQFSCPALLLHPCHVFVCVCVCV